MRILPIVVGGPCELFCDRCLTSLYAQGWTKPDSWKACVVVDPIQGDSTAIKVKKYETDFVKIVINETQKFGLANTVKAVELLKPKDEDVLITVDLDDWLKNFPVFDLILKEYTKDPNLLMTYGSWVSHPNPKARTNCFPYTVTEWDNGIRRAMFRATHLRSFKYKLWKHINQEDFLDENGNYFQSCYDMSFMVPMLEMAGDHRVKFIDTILYVYNQETPYNDYKVRSEQQRYYTQYIMNKTPYKML